VVCNFLMRRIGTCSALLSQIGELIAPFACSGTSRGVGNQGSESCRVGENAVLGVGEVVQGSPSTPEPMDLYNGQMEAQRRDFTKARVSTSRQGGAELEHECIFTDGDEPHHAVAILVRLAPQFEMKRRYSLRCGGTRREKLPDDRDQPSHA
jgi:hypothetical protein